MVVQGCRKTGIPLAINGIFGNMGVASAAFFTGFFIDNIGWRSAFFVPGAVSIVLGLFYLMFVRTQTQNDAETPERPPAAGRSKPASLPGPMLRRVFGVIFFTTAVGGLIFQSTTFALPKVFDERLAGLAGSATMGGWYTFLVFALAALSQLVIGYLLDNHSLRAVFSVVAFVQAVFFSVMTQLSGIPALLVAFGFMFVVFGQIPINDVLVGRIARSEWRSRAYAIRYIVTFSVMAATLPLIGWVHGEWGFNRLFGILAVAASLIFIAVLFLPKSKETLLYSPSTV